MYERYYEMRVKAFPCQPTPSVFFESPMHRGAFYFLTTGIEEGEPFMLVTGAYGMGKTLLALRLTQYLAQRNVAYVEMATSIISYAELLERLADACGLLPDSNDAASLQSLLFKHLKGKSADERPRLILVLDEMQDCDVPTLVRIRMLSNFNVDGYYPFQLIMFGHPSLETTLQSAELESLNQRIRRRYQLKPFNLLETKEYIYFRLLQSGAKGSPYFPDETIDVIHESSRGIPRFINNICDSSLLIGAANNLREIMPEVAREAATTAGGIPPCEPAQPIQEAPAPPPTSSDLSAPAPREDEGAHWALATRPSPGGKKLYAAVALLMLVGMVAALYSRGLLPFPKTAISAAEDTGMEEPREEAALAAATENSSDMLDTEADRDAAAAQQAGITAYLDPVTNYGAGAGMPAFLVDSNKNVDATLGADTYSITPSVGDLAFSTPQGSLRDLSSFPYATASISPPPQTAVRNPSTATAPSAEPVAPLVMVKPAEPVAAPPKAPAAAETGDLGQAESPFSLQVIVSSNRDEAVTIINTLRAEGVPDLFLSETLSGSSASRWVVLQGCYRSAEAAEKAREQLQLAHSTVGHTPYAVAINGSADGEAAQRLQQMGLTPYQPESRHVAGELLVGAFADLPAASALEQRLRTEGYEATVVRR